MKEILTEEIDHVKREAIRNLKSHYRQREDKAGWHQYLGSEKIGTSATAQILFIFKFFNEDFNHRTRIEKCLLNEQIKYSKNSRSNGGWPYVSNFPGTANTEATCWALLALHDNHHEDPGVQAGLGWLLKNAIKQEADQGWGIMPGDISRVYTTCLALVTLKTFGKSNTLEFERGLNWLMKVQNDDKGWGSKDGSPSSITYTARAIITLISIGYNKQNTAFHEGVQWLLRNTRSILQTRAHVKEEYRECIEFRNRRLYFYHMPVQTTLIALILSGYTNSYTVFDGVNELIKYNNSYYWSHPSFENSKRKPLWAIFDTLMVCKALQETTYNWNDIKAIRSQGKDIIYATKAHPFSFEQFKQRFVFGNWGKIFMLICVGLMLYVVIDAFPQLNAMAYMSIVVFPLLIELVAYYITEKMKDKRK